MISYGQFIGKLRRDVWPHPGEVASLVEAHNRMFLEALTDLCDYVPCLQEMHTDVIPACSAYVQCGMSVSDAPYGEIERIYSIANGDFCSKVFYDPAPFVRLQGISSRLLDTFSSPANVGWPVLPQGLKYPERSTDSPWGRSRAGLWAVHRQRLHVVPWLQSNESLVVEWAGVKTLWNDTDLLDEALWNVKVAAAIKAYVKWHHFADFTETTAMELRDMERLYLDARAEVVYWCQERTRQKERQTYNVTLLEGEGIPSSAQLAAEKVPSADSSSIVFAMLGDFGNASIRESDVADLIKGWNPEFIVSTGDNWYGASGNQTRVELSDLDAMVGAFFSPFLFPYIGNYGDGASGVQRFFPTIGNHDRDPDGRLALTEQYFNLDNSYYTVVRGPVQFFFYDAGYDSSQINQQSDGIKLGSKQAGWLQAQLALSTALFKVVLLHQPPYSSCVSTRTVEPLPGDGTLSYPDLRLPFKDWGADVVMSGHAHNYERLLGPDGMIYIVNGAGGQASNGDEPASFVDEPLPLSVLRYNDDYGAMRCVADCTSLTLAFYSRGGTLIDTVTILK